MRVRSTHAPKPIEITNTQIFVAENISEYEEVFDDYTIRGFEYDCKTYDKDEYILLMSRKNEDLQNEILDTQMALCDIYESLGGDTL